MCIFRAHAHTHTQTHTRAHTHTHMHVRVSAHTTPNLVVGWEADIFNFHCLDGVLVILVGKWDLVHYYGVFIG